MAQIVQRGPNGQFLPGFSGNPAGRPRGPRSKLAEEFIKALRADFAAKGAQAIADVREGDPTQYLKLIAWLLPKDWIEEPAQAAPLLIVERCIVDPAPAS